MASISGLTGDIQLIFEVVGGALGVGGGGSSPTLTGHLVPYQGATANVELGTFSLSADALSAGAERVGTLWFNDGTSMTTAPIGAAGIAAVSNTGVAGTAATIYKATVASTAYIKSLSAGYGIGITNYDTYISISSSVTGTSGTGGGSGSITGGFNLSPTVGLGVYSNTGDANLNFWVLTGVNGISTKYNSLSGTGTSSIDIALTGEINLTLSGTNGTTVIVDAGNKTITVRGAGQGVSGIAAGFVPYEGASADVNLRTYALTARHISAESACFGTGTTVLNTSGLTGDTVNANKIFALEIGTKNQTGISGNSLTIFDSGETNKPFSMTGGSNYGTLRLCSNGLSSEASLGFKSGADLITASWVIGKYQIPADPSFFWYFNGVKTSLSTDGQFSTSGSLMSYGNAAGLRFDDRSYPWVSSSGFQWYGSTNIVRLYDHRNARDIFTISADSGSVSSRAGAIIPVVYKAQNVNSSNGLSPVSAYGAIAGLYRLTTYCWGSVLDVGEGYQPGVKWTYQSSAAAGLAVTSSSGAYGHTASSPSDLVAFTRVFYHHAQGSIVVWVNLSSTGGGADRVGYSSILEKLN